MIQMCQPKGDEMCIGTVTHSLCEQNFIFRNHKYVLNTHVTCSPLCVAYTRDVKMNFAISTNLRVQVDVWELRGTLLNMGKWVRSKNIKRGITRSGAEKGEERVFERESCRSDD